tara:strand:- start:1414 stop:1791 length:378 start_codon:yes stop_codon:yes gene_type:complete
VNILGHILLICLSAFTASALADWVQFDTDVNNNKYFLENDIITGDANLIFVWQRIQYAKSTVYGDYSSSTYYKINCHENTIQLLSTTFYSDRNWASKNWAGKRGQENIIKSNSQEDKLRNAVCKE